MIKNKLKQEKSGSISAKISSYIEIEIHWKVHKLLAEILVASAQSLLNWDSEYISFVYKLLPKVQKKKRV